MKMVSCKFFIGWMDGSDGACGEKTGINSPGDLNRLYNEGSEHVTCYEYDAPKGFEWEIGASMAFRQNFTAHDTFSDYFIEKDGGR